MLGKSWPRFLASRRIGTSPKEPTPVSLWTPGGPRASSLSVAGMYRPCHLQAEGGGEPASCVPEGNLGPFSALGGWGERSEFATLLFKGRGGQGKGYQVRNTR